MTDDDHKPTRQERRERKRSSNKARIPKHGRTIGELYRQAIEKRNRELDKKKKR